MRDFIAGNRLISNELRAVMRDGTQGTLVVSGTEVTRDAEDRYAIASGEIAIDGTTQTVTDELKTISLPGNNEYRYDTLSRDANGDVVVTTGDTGTINDDGTIDQAVPEPNYPNGYVYLATAILFEDGINEIYDGRSVWANIPSEALN